MRNVQTFFREIKQLLDLKVGKKNSLDERVGQKTRLRRVPNTVNMSSSDGNGNARYCIPLTIDDLRLDIEEILTMALKPSPFTVQKKRKKRGQFSRSTPY